MSKLYDHDAHELPFDVGALLKATQVKPSGDAIESDKWTDGRQDCSNVPPEVLTEQEAAEHEAAWFDATLDASGFFALAHVSPVEAAMLLCGLNPHHETEGDAKNCTTGYTSPENFQHLRRTFSDIHYAKPGSRSMLDWMRIADNAGRAFHPWARRYVKHQGLENQLKPETGLITAAQVKESAVSAPGWLVKKPQRWGGYRGPLHRLLAAAQRDGKSRPSARDVLEMWRINTPSEIAKMLPDGFDYYDAKGNTKSADLTTISKTIDRMTDPR